MLRAKELTLSHENLRDAHKYRKGAWQRASNILSCMTMMSGTTGTTYLVIDSVGKAKKAFASGRQPYTEADVLRVELPNTPGALARFAGKLTQEDINITLGYQTSTKGSRKVSIVLAVSDLAKADRIR
jgi:hypothetical protein